MQIVITPDDFYRETGLPKPPLARLVNAWGDSLADERAPGLVSPPPKPVTVVIDENWKPKEVICNCPPQGGAPAPNAPLTETQPEPPQETPPAPKTEPKPKTKKRRTKAEIEAADDAACQLELVNAKAEGREPSKDNLPTDTRKRVGDNPKSWVDPQVYASIMATPCPAPAPVEETVETPLQATGTDDPTPAVIDDEQPQTTDFSQYLDNDTSEKDPEVDPRFELELKLIELGQRSRPAAQAIVKSWQFEYSTVKVPELPENVLGKELRKVEDALDAQQKG